MSLVQESIKDDSHVEFLVHASMVTNRQDRMHSRLNRLALDPKYNDYSPQKYYQEYDFLHLTAPLSEIKNNQLNSTPSTIFTRYKSLPYFPWMKMGNISNHGSLAISVTGGKIDNFSQAYHCIQREVLDRIPSFQHIPTIMSQDRIMSSWDYFKMHFDAYIRGDEFPIMKDVDNTSEYSRIDS